MARESAPATSREKLNSISLEADSIGSHRRRIRCEHARNGLEREAEIRAAE